MVRTAAEEGESGHQLAPLLLPVSTADAEQMAASMDWADEMANSGACHATQDRYSRNLYNVINQAVLQHARGNEDQLQLLTAFDDESDDVLPTNVGLPQEHGWCHRAASSPPILVLSLPLSLAQTKRTMAYLHTDPATNQKVDDADALSLPSIRTYSNAWLFLHTRHGSVRTDKVKLFMCRTKEGEPHAAPTVLLSLALFFPSPLPFPSLPPPLPSVPLSTPQRPEERCGAHNNAAASFRALRGS